LQIWRTLFFVSKMFLNFVEAPFHWTAKQIYIETYSSHTDAKFENDNNFITPMISSVRLELLRLFCTDIT